MLLRGKGQFPSHQIVNTAAMHRPEIKELWEEGGKSWSCEPEPDAEFCRGTSSQLHEQGFQQCNSFLDTSRDLVPSDFLPFVSNWLILLT